MYFTKAMAFADTVCAQIRWAPYRPAVHAELLDHIEDHIWYLVDERGYTLYDAEDEAISAMGDPEELGKSLNLIHRPYQSLLVICITLAFWTSILYVLFRLYCGLTGKG